MFTNNTVEYARLTVFVPVFDTFLLLAARKYGNSKTTGGGHIPMIDTTILSYDQVIFNDFELDESNCGDCPRSYNNKRDGLACYTHGGHERLALNRMIADTHKANEAGLIPNWSFELLEEWGTRALTLLRWATRKDDAAYDFLRHGRYGDPAFVPLDLLFWLNDWFRSQAPGGTIVGYTHQAKLARMAPAMSFLQHSAETVADVRLAASLGHASFFAAKAPQIAAMRSAFPDRKFVQCPASKQARALQKTPVSCYDCGGCGGTDAARPNYYIIQH